MKLTKFAHACVRLEQDGRRLVIDPGVFSAPTEALAAADVVLITHEHPDHLDTPAVVAALAQDPALTVYAPAGVAASLRAAAPEAAGRVHDAVPGQAFTAAGFAVRCVGGLHATILPALAPVANVGYVFDGGLFHPGDSLIVPDGVSVTTLLVPLHAPWSKLAEVVEFVAAVRAPRAFPIHDVLLSDVGRTITGGHLAREAAGVGCTFSQLAVGESVEV